AAFQLSAQADKIKVNLDLVNVSDDKVTVTITPPKINQKQAVVMIPKTVPGTYSADDHARMAAELKALDTEGRPLTVAKPDANTVVIPDAKCLAKVTYRVNDSYDEGRTYNVFSPAGTNVDEDNSVVLNLHGFVGDLK